MASQGKFRTRARCPDSSPGHFPFYKLTVCLETWIIILGVKGPGLRLKHFPVTNDSVNTFSKIHNKTKVLAGCSLNSRIEAHLGLLPLVWLPAKLWGWRWLQTGFPVLPRAMLAWSQARSQPPDYSFLKYDEASVPTYISPSSRRMDPSPEGFCKMYGKEELWPWRCFRILIILRW